ncbi:hypothetical protein [Leptospira adleri]|uniref:hypothetical protein n=1 Tax=Leptospira adleri TaxID=2023186 RepID=UPI0010844378|nr:hypothetical protein [Leptospira adleri]TGM59855.1 hypothetical protein EHQ97_04125 [Leptospira adleri]
MVTIRRWSGGLFLLGIAFNLICASWMNFSGACPAKILNSRQTTSQQSPPACHEKTSDHDSSESPSPCCSTDIVKTDSSLEFRLDIQKFLQSNVIFVLYLFSSDQIFNPNDSFLKTDRSQSLSVLEFKPVRSLLQVFRI